MYSKIFVLLLLVSVVTMASLGLQEQWKSYKDTHGKVYEAEEDQRRCQIFQENLKKIEEHNKLFDEGKVTWRMGVNKFTDFSPEEVSKGLLVPKGLAGSS